MEKQRSRMHSGQTIKCIHAAVVTNRDRGLPVLRNYNQKTQLIDR
jgi:hypothetical protein